MNLAVHWIITSDLQLNYITYASDSHFKKPVNNIYFYHLITDGLATDGESLIVDF